MPQWEAPAEPLTSAHAEIRQGTACVQVCENGFAGQCGLSLGNQGMRASRQIDIHARTEADQPEPLARADLLALPLERDDPARNKACDLNDADPSACARDDERIAFIVFARLVEI